MSIQACFRCIAAFGHPTFREKGPNGPATEFALSTEGPKGASNFRISPTSSTSDVFT